MTDNAFAGTQRFLAQAGAWLMLGGLLTGGFAAAAMTGQINADPHAALAAHLNALLGSFWMFAVAWSLPFVRYGETGLKRLAYAVVVANYSNWIVTAIKALLKVAGLNFDQNPANNAIFVVLNVAVVLPALAAAAAWAWGMTRRAPEPAAQIALK